MRLSCFDLPCPEAAFALSDCCACCWFGLVPTARLVRIVISLYESRFRALHCNAYDMISCPCLDLHFKPKGKYRYACVCAYSFVPPPACDTGHRHVASACNPLACTAITPACCSLISRTSRCRAPFFRRGGMLTRSGCRHKRPEIE